MLYGEIGGYFAPADFSAPLATHLATERTFDELGEGFADQQLRHMLQTSIVFVPSPSLDMVVSSHLLSLANGFGRVDSELLCMFLVTTREGTRDQLSSLTHQHSLARKRH